MANELRQLVDTANAPIFGIDFYGNVNEWNDKTAEITGFTKEEAKEKPLVSTFIVEKLRPSVQQVLDNALQGNETSNYELEFETKSKEIRYLLVNATTRRDEENNIVGGENLSIFLFSYSFNLIYLSPMFDRTSCWCRTRCDR